MRRRSFCDADRGSVRRPFVLVVKVVACFVPALIIVLVFPGVGRFFPYLTLLLDFPKGRVRPGDKFVFINSAIFEDLCFICVYDLLSIF